MLHVIILAAGQGTRMKSKLPKVLHKIGGKPMLAHVIDAAQALNADACYVVHGHGGEVVRGHFADDDSLKWVLQPEQLGTGHAVLQALPLIPDEGTVLILYGDVPLIQPQTLEPLLAAAAKGLSVLTMQLEQPKGYGRVIRKASKNGNGTVLAVVEENDATEAQKLIKEVNTGVMAAPAALLKSWVSHIKNDNKKGEYYLTDVVSLAVQDEYKVQAVSTQDPFEVMGCNDRLQLAEQERVLQKRQADALLRAGVSLANPALFELRGSLTHGQDVFIDVGCILEGQVHLADDVQVGAYCLLKNVQVGAGSVIAAHSVLENCVVGAGCKVGPFARLRPETVLFDRVHIGNFVELKKTTMGEGSKANHLAYVGDATVGERVNISAGVITCNYDGVNKHPTTIGNDAFIGTDSQLIAPIHIGDNAYVAAGSTLSKDVADGSLAICRAREQKTVAHWKRPQKK
jgi:bifunctional UDP-N-acetylglucosamine pyrophosphorylase/glucosamine-1-phosphate N-acetyltransferase